MHYWAGHVLELRYPAAAASNGRARPRDPALPDGADDPNCNYLVEAGPPFSDAPTLSKPGGLGLFQVWSSP